MLVTRRSGEIQTRKDDSWRGRAIKSLFRQITTNQRQHSSLCYRHTLPYRINAVKSASSLDQAMITIYRGWPAHRNWTTRLQELLMRSSTRRRPNPQKRQSPHLKATKEASIRCNASCTPRRNEVHSASKRSGLLARDQQWHQGNGKGLRDLQQASASTSQIANTVTRTP